MTVETLLLTLVGATFVVAGLRVLRAEADPTVRLWTVGWMAFLAAGLLGRVLEISTVGPTDLPLFAAYVASSAAPLLFLFGVFRLVRYQPPAWVAPMAAAIVAARAVSGVFGDRLAAELLSIPVEVFANFGAAVLIYRWARRSDLPNDQVALVAAHAFMGIAEGFMAVTWMQGWDRLASKLILSASTVLLAGTQMVVVLRRSSARVDEVIDDRERDLALLRDLAHLGTQHTAGPALLQEAARLLVERLPIHWVGFWRWSNSGGRWVASEARDVPADVCAEVQLLALRVEDLATQPGGAPPPDLLSVSEGCAAAEEESCAFVPLEWKGEVLGVMGLGCNAPGPVRQEVKSVLSTLAGELSLTLRHVLSIQQRDHANLDLLRERRKLNAVIDTTPIGLLVTTADGRIELMNRAAADHVGCVEPMRLIGRTMTEFLDDLFTRIADPDALVEQVRQHTDANGYLREVEIEVLRPDDPATLLLFSSIVRDDEGRPTARIWASRDVTRERALGDQLRHAQKLETIGTLSGGIAHDFNNQLAVILGNVRFAKDTLEDEGIQLADVDEALCDLERAADHCAQLTRSLLSFARRAPVSLGHLAPNRLVRELGELLRPLLPSNIALECVADPELPQIMADGAQLQQVLVNLALNARDAIDEHGTIEIRACVEDLDVERLRLRGLGRPGQYVVFHVSDTGHGLSADTVGRIFEPFYTTKPVGKGTGLGLAIVHGVVTAHGGWVDVESEQGEGTTFHIYLPADADDVVAAATATTPVASPDIIALSTVGDHRDRILIADDDPAVRSILVRALELRRFDVVAAVDGEDAVKRFREDGDGFVAVVLDWSMPGLDGPEAAAEILAIDPDVPILVATGHGQLETAHDLEIIAKPFDMDFLASRIRSRIDGIER